MAMNNKLNEQKKIQEELVRKRKERDEAYAKLSYQEKQQQVLNQLEENAKKAAELAGRDNKHEALAKRSMARYQAHMEIWGKDGIYSKTLTVGGVAQTSKRSYKNSIFIGVVAFAAMGVGLFGPIGILFALVGAPVAYGLKLLFYKLRDQYRIQGVLGVLKTLAIVPVGIAIGVGLFAAFGLLPALVGFGLGSYVYRYLSTKTDKLKDRSTLVKAAIWGGICFAIAFSVILSLSFAGIAFPSILSGGTMLSLISSASAVTGSAILSGLLSAITALPAGLLALSSFIFTAIPFGIGAAIAVAAPFILPVILAGALLYAAYQSFNSPFLDAKSMAALIDKTGKAMSSNTPTPPVAGAGQQQTTLPPSPLPLPLPSAPPLTLPPSPHPRPSAPPMPLTPTGQTSTVTPPAQQTQSTGQSVQPKHRPASISTAPVPLYSDVMPPSSGSSPVTSQEPGMPTSQSTTSSAQLQATVSQQHWAQQPSGLSSSSMNAATGNNPPQQGATKTEGSSGGPPVTRTKS